MSRRSVCENHDGSREYRPNGVRSVHTTEVKIRELKSGECIHREWTCVLSLRRGLAISELSGKFIAFNHSLTVH